MSKSRKVRIRFLQKPLEAQIPEVVRMLLTHYLASCKAKNLCQLSFVVPGKLPLSLNHQKKRIVIPHMKGGRALRDIYGKVILRGSEALKPEVHDFRAATAVAIGLKKANWKPIGVTAAIVLFESPVWLTAEFRVRKEDADNKIKPTLDAAERATEIGDELHFQFHAFKIPSRKERTVVWLFDLGDVVDYYD